MTNKSLLPRNTTPLERATEATMLKFDPAMQVPTIWNASNCPKRLLPWFAWALSVDDWETDWSTEKKRAAIEESIEIHEHKGTPAAIMRALAIRGQPDAILIERSHYIRHDGAATRNGYYYRGGPGMWATFRIILQRPITIDQSQAILRMIASVKRNCCWLMNMDFTAAALRHNGYATRNGTYTRGLITI
jgi:phage tail protein, P2 protein I family